MSSIGEKMDFSKKNPITYDTYENNSNKLMKKSVTKFQNMKKEVLRFNTKALCFKKVNKIFSRQNPRDISRNSYSISGISGIGFNAEG